MVTSTDVRSPFALRSSPFALRPSLAPTLSLGLRASLVRQLIEQFRTQDEPAYCGLARYVWACGRVDDGWHLDGTQPYYPQPLTRRSFVRLFPCLQRRDGLEQFGDRPSAGLERVVEDLPRADARLLYSAGDGAAGGHHAHPGGLFGKVQWGAGRYVALSRSRRSRRSPARPARPARSHTRVALPRAHVDIFPYGSVDVDEFREMVKRACSSSDYHLIVSYSRKHFQQTGDGHFSPIGGYSPSHDMALILDTARFKYPPHWVPLSMLHEAMAYEDPTTGKPRGFLKVMASRTLHSVLFALDCSVEDDKWGNLVRWIDEDVVGGVSRVVDDSDGADKGDEGSASCSAGNGVHGFVVRLCMSVDPDVLASRTVRRVFILETSGRRRRRRRRRAPSSRSPTTVSRSQENASCDNGTCVQSDAVETLLSEVEMLHLFEDVRAAVDAAGRQGGVDAYEVQKRVLLVLMLEEVIVQAAEAAGWGDDLVASLKACLINESKEKYRVVGHEVEYLKVGIEHATDDRRPRCLSHYSGCARGIPGSIPRLARPSDRLTLHVHVQLAVVRRSLDAEPRHGIHPPAASVSPSTTRRWIHPRRHKQHPQVLPAWRTSVARRVRA